MSPCPPGRCHRNGQEQPATPGPEQGGDEARARAEEALDYVEQLLEAYFMQASGPAAGGWHDAAGLRR